MIPAALLAESFKLRLLCSSHKLIAIQIFWLNNEFLKNYPQKRVFCNVSLSSFEDVLQRNPRTESGSAFLA